VLGDGEFEWGVMARTPLRPEGIPLSTAAARLVQLLDGQTNRAIFNISLLIHGAVNGKIDGSATIGTLIMNWLHSKTT
jgi:hypothetical protein